MLIIERVCPQQPGISSATVHNVQVWTVESRVLDSDSLRDCKAELVVASKEKDGVFRDGKELD